MIPDLEQLRRVAGAGAVNTGDDDRSSYSHDAWPLAAVWTRRGRHPHVPEAVVRITGTAQAARLLRWASEHGVPVTPWGLGSSVTGAPLPLRGGVVADCSAMSGIVRLDDADLTVTVKAGTLGSDLEEALHARGLTLGHSPQSLHLSTVGGWVATRASGQFSSRYGSIEDLVVTFTVVLAEGEVVTFPLSPRAAVGPDLRHLFIGAEGTLGLVTEVTLRVWPLATRQRLAALRFADLDDGLEVLRLITRAGLRPHLVRLYDEDEARHLLRDDGFTGCALLLGSEGSTEIVDAEHAACLAICDAHGGSSLGAGPVESWLARRFDFSTVEERLRTSGGFAETIEVAHFWSGIEPLYRALKAALAPLADEVLCHFSHVYPQGTSLYLILLGQAGDDAAAERALHALWERAMALCLEHGATISHHHGVGIARLPYLADALGGSHGLLRRVKAALDPAGVLNPGKLGLDASGAPGAPVRAVRGASVAEPEP
jgi:alkyldihydroxyacetonephosphate synthase